MSSCSESFFKSLLIDDFGHLCKSHTEAVKSMINEKGAWLLDFVDLEEHQEAHDVIIAIHEGGLNLLIY